MSFVSIGLRTEKTEDNPLGYKTVENIPNNDVCVLYLGGDGATNDKAANGYAKIIENEILDTLSSDVPVYSVTYNFEDNKQSISRRLEFIKHRTEVLLSDKKLDKIITKATEEEYNPQYIDELFEKTILPRISLHKGKGRLTTDEACKRIRKLNIVAHCHGGYVAHKLEEKMQQAMSELGYNKQESKLIQSQLLIIAHAPACPLGISKSQFISFKSVYDDQIPQANNWFTAYLERRKFEERKRFYAESINNTEDINKYSWFDFEPCYFPNKQGNLFMIKQKYEWHKEEGPFLVNPDEHNDLHYNVSNQTEPGKMMARFAQTILRNGIKNSLEQKDSFIPLPPIEKLILSDDSQINDKIMEAFAKMSENGKNFRAEVCRYALNSISNIKQNTN